MVCVVCKVLWCLVLFRGASSVLCCVVMYGVVSRRDVVCYVVLC